METEVTATKFSLVGIEDLVWSIEEDVLFPLKIQRYGAANQCEEDHHQLAGLKPSPKFILISGYRGSGKSAVTSVLVNELRKGSLTKSADVFYSERDVKYLTLTFEGYIDDGDDDEHHLIENMRALFSAARHPADDGRDFTVLAIPDLHYLCPRDWGNVGEEEERKRQSRSRPRRLRRPRKPAAVEFINALIQELDKTLPGKILVVGHTSEPEEVDTVLKAKLDYSYAIPHPAEQARRAMIPEFLEELRAEYRQDIGFFVRYTQKFTPGDIRDLLSDVVEEAKYRIRIERRGAGVEEPDSSAEQSGERIGLIKNDFLFCMNGYKEDGEEDQDPSPEAPIGAEEDDPVAAPESGPSPPLDIAEPDDTEEEVLTPVEAAAPAPALGLDQLPIPTGMMKNPRVQELIQEMFDTVNPLLDELHQRTLEVRQNRQEFQERVEELRRNHSGKSSPSGDEDDEDYTTTGYDSSSDSDSGEEDDDDSEDSEGNQLEEEPSLNEEVVDKAAVIQDGLGDDFEKFVGMEGMEGGDHDDNDNTIPV